MKAELTKDGIEIRPENIAESYALQYLFPIKETCETCGKSISTDKIIIDTSIETGENNGE